MKISTLLVALQLVSIVYSAVIDAPPFDTSNSPLRGNGSSNAVPLSSPPPQEGSGGTISSLWPPAGLGDASPPRDKRLHPHPGNGTAHLQRHVFNRRSNATARAGEKKKMLVYVLCFDTVSCQTAHEQFDVFSWSIILKLPKSIFFETYAFTHTFPDRIKKDAWHKYEYVGTISWKAPLKFEHAFRFGPLNMTEVVESAPPGTDVIALVGQKNESQNMVDKAVVMHQRLKEIWDSLLKAYERYSPEEISTDGMSAFYCNYWLAKPEHVMKLIPFMKKAHTLLESLTSIQDALWSNAHYLDNKALSQKVFGLNYYTYHPFVLERLTPFFFNTEKLSIYVYKKFSKVFVIKSKYLPVKKEKKKKYSTSDHGGKSFVVHHGAGVNRTRSH